LEQIERMLAGQGAAFRKTGASRQSAALKYSNKIFNNLRASNIGK